MKKKFISHSLFVLGFIFIFSISILGFNKALALTPDTDPNNVQDSQNFVPEPTSSGNSGGTVSGSAGTVNGNTGGTISSGSSGFQNGNTVKTEVVKLKSPLKADTNLSVLINSILNLLLTIASIGAVLYIIYIGFEYVMARGNESKIAELHQKFLWTAVGIGIIFSAKLIAYVIFSTIQTLQK
jgi:hypothetical protein